MGFVGADSGELRDLARLMRHSADRLDRDVVTSIATTLRNNPWSGPDAEHFRRAWSQDSVRRLHTVAGGLREAAASLERNATEQDRASAGEGGVPAISHARGLAASISDGFRALGTQSKVPAWFAALGIGLAATKEAVSTTGKVTKAAAAGMAAWFGKFSPRVPKGLPKAGTFRSVKDIPLLKRGLMMTDVKNYTATRAANSAAGMKGARTFGTVTKTLGKAGKLLGALGAGLSFASESQKQLQADAMSGTGMDQMTRYGRATLKGSAVAAGGALGAKGGAAIGAAVGAATLGPFGAVLGGLVGGFIGSQVASGAAGWAADGVLGMVK